MATFDELRLQQLLAPFENNRGIVSTNNAVPMLNNIPMIDTFSLYQKNQVPLVDQINQSNEVMTKLAIDEDGNIKTVANPNFNFKPYKSTQIYDPAFGDLVYRPGGMSYQLNDPRMIFPTYGGVSGYRKVGDGIDSIPSTGGITELDLSRFQNVSNLGRDDEDVEQVEYLPGAKPKEGIARLFELLGNIPTPFNLIKRGLESFRGLNQRIRQSDFGRSKNLMDYLDMKKYGGFKGREKARAATMTQARGIQKKIDRGDFGGPSVSIDRGRTPQARAAATRSRDLGKMRGGVGR